MAAGKGGKQPMLRYLLSFAIIFSMVTSYSFAKNDDASLQNEYGQDLTQAPFFLRFAYQRKYDKDWSKTTYTERKVYLKDYETGLVKQKAQDKADALAQAQSDKELRSEQREADLQARGQLREEEEENKADEAADEQRQKDFDASLKEQQKELEQMQRAAVEGNN